MHYQIQRLSRTTTFPLTRTHTHAGIVSALADERHGKDVYESSFKYVLGTLLKVDEKLLADHIAHYRLASAARTKAWELKAIQSKVSALPIITITL